MVKQRSKEGKSLKSIERIVQLVNLEFPMLVLSENWTESVFLTQVVGICIFGH